MFSSLRALPSRAAVSAALAVTALAAPATAQETNVWTTATVAGGNVNDGGPAASGWLHGPSGVALDASGNLYIADWGNHRIRKVNTAGVITTITGTGTAGFSDPDGVAVDGSGNLYIADGLNDRIRKVDAATGIISTVAGDGTSGFSGDGGQATAAQLYHPIGVALDGSGNLYIADLVNQRIRKVDAATGIISTVAGGGSSLGDGGPATSAQLSHPWDVTADGSGNVYIADRNNHRIRKVDASTGNISTVAGTGTGGYSGDGGAATAAQINYPADVAVDGAGNLYIADIGNHRIRKVTASTGNISTAAGTGTQGYSGDSGPATAAQLNRPADVAVDGAGNLYIADRNNHRIRKVDAATGNISTVAGTTADVGDGGLAASAHLRSPRGVAVDGESNVYIADSGNHRVRKVDAAGVITTFAGTGTQGYSGDGGAAAAAQLNEPIGVALDGSGNLYIADTGNHRIRKVDASTGNISTVAGTGSGAYGGDGGPATAARIYAPASVAVDAAGNVYIGDRGNNRIRKVDAATGNISTVAGTTQGYSGDGGPAMAAQLNWTYGVALDGAGNLYIADSLNLRIRKVDAESGTISTIAGRTVTPTALFVPRGVAADGAGNLYIADRDDHRVLRAAALPPLPSNPQAPGRVIEDVGGDGTPGGDGDGGPAANARVNSPSGVAIDGAGNRLYRRYAQQPRTQDRPRRNHR